ncbi:MAG: hypothetical protein JNK25_03720 [Phycisphaerae bacterium]|nr:hypothetical protein [Phycisphaerae bacterium]
MHEQPLSNATHSSDMPYLPPEPPQWPKVVGIISIVWAGIALTCIPCGMIGPFVYPAILPPEMMEGGLPPNMQVSPIMLGMNAAGLLLSLLLLTAGVMTIKRAAAGRTLHLAYAWLQVPAVIFSFWFVTKMAADVRTWVANNPDHPLAKGQSASGPDMNLIIGVVMTVIFGVIYPLFLLIWFQMVKRTPQSMIEPSSQSP